MKLNTNMMKNFLSRELKIKELEIHETTVGEKTLIIITVETPDTAWEVERPKILINNDERKVEIEVKGKRKERDIGLQVITNKKLMVNIVFQVSGKWNIKCNNIRKTIEVKERKEKEKGQTEDK